MSIVSLLNQFGHSESENAILAVVTLPRFKVRWLQTHDRKDKAKASLLAERWKSVWDEDQQTSTTSTPTHTDSAMEHEFFSFEDEDDTSATAESQVVDYLKSGAQGMDRWAKMVKVYDWAVWVDE